MTNPDRSEAARLLGSGMTPAKAKALKKNLVKARAARWLKDSSAPCECGMPNGKHKTKCPVWRREHMARYRARKKAASDPKE